MQKNTEFSFKNILYNKNKTYNIILYNKSLKSNSYSDTIYHDIKISNLYLEESDSLHSIPQTSINRIINKKDTLVIKFPKASKSIQKMIKDKIQNKGKFKFFNYLNDEMRFVARNNISAYEIPKLDWTSRKSSKPLLIEYKILNRVSNDSTLPINFFSIIYRLNYSSLSFEFADMQRYVSRKSTDIPLKLPSLIMRQKGEGENIVRKDDKIIISFNEEIAEHIEWAYNQISSDDFASIDRIGEDLLLTVKKDLDSLNEYIFPDLYFNLKGDHSFKIALDIKVLPKDATNEESWNFLAKHVDEGLIVSKMDISSVTHTPIYASSFSYEYPEAQIALIEIKPEQNMLLIEDDIITINFNGVEVDTEKDFEAPGSNLYLYEIKNNSISFKVENTNSNITQPLIIRNIPIKKESIDIINASFNISIKGSNNKYAYEGPSVVNKFHEGDTKELYFEINQDSYRIPEFRINNLQPISDKDTLYITGKDIIYQKDLYQEALSKYFKPLKNNRSKDRLIFIYSNRTS